MTPSLSLIGSVVFVSKYSNLKMKVKWRSEIKTTEEIITCRLVFIMKIFVSKTKFGLCFKNLHENEAHKITEKST